MKALFEQDPEIHFDFNDEDDELIMRVDNPTKAAALDELLPGSVKFGDVTLYITVVPGNVTYTKADLFRIAFTGNPAFSFVESINDDETISFPANYCVFKNEVVQFPADDLSSYYGVKSTLYEDIAKEVFDGRHDGVYFCTDLPESERFF